MPKKNKSNHPIQYLTETSLGLALSEIFPDAHFTHDKTVPTSGIRTRPDYRCDDPKLIVEFNGPHHYCKSGHIKRDTRKSDLYEKMGFKVVRIPYFVQLSSETIREMFGVPSELPQQFPHGFIIKTVTLPADFCELGIELFKEDLIRFRYIRKEIVQSLKDKVSQLGDIHLVVPPSLTYLLAERASQ